MPCEHVATPIARLRAGDGGRCQNPNPPISEGPPRNWRNDAEVVPTHCGNGNVSRDEGSQAHDATYRNRPRHPLTQAPTFRLFGPQWVPVAIGAHALGLVLFAIAFTVAVRTPEPGDLWVFTILFLAYVFICWWNLFVTAYELRLEDGIISWRAVLRSGELLARDIRSIRNVVPSWPWPFVRIGGPGSPSVFTSGTGNLPAFVDALISERAEIDVDERSYRSWHHSSPFV